MRSYALLVAVLMSVLMNAAVSVAIVSAQNAAPRAQTPARPWPPARLADGQPDVQGT